MLKNKVALISSFITFIILSFLVWQFLLSIYEVKYIYNFNPSDIRTNNIYEITAVAINSFGWSLSFRNSEFSIKIIKGHSLIELNNHSDNSVYFQIKGNGEIELELDSRYSLNPTLLKFENQDRRN